MHDSTYSDKSCLSMFYSKMNVKRQAVKLCPIHPLPIRLGEVNVLICHFEEQQVGQLLQVIAVANAVIPQGIAEVPDFRNDAGCGHDLSSNLIRVFA